MHPERGSVNSQQGVNVNNNFLTHQTERISNESQPSSSTAESESASPLTFSNFNFANQVILSTILLNISDKSNKVHLARALLDCGSQSSFISNELCAKIGCDTSRVNLLVNGINNTSSKIKYKCNVNIHSTLHNFQTHLNCFVVPEITGNIPATDIDFKNLKIPDHLKLADRSFHKAKRVDMLIGNDLFWDILLQGKFSLGKGQPFMQNTLFGWIITGPYVAKNCGQIQNNHMHCNLITNMDIQSQLSKFWELEEITGPKINLSKEELACDEHFVENTQRDMTGRFIVSLPLLEPTSNLGDSLYQAKSRFINLERKLGRDIKLKTLYTDFIEEYLHLGHMKSLGTPFIRH